MIGYKGQQAFIWNLIRKNKVKVKDIPPEFLEQLIELETQNIIPVLASVGFILSVKDVRDWFVFFRESDIVLSERDGLIWGFAMFEVELSQAKILTFSLRKFNSRRILRDLLLQVMECLKSSEITHINSRANVTNQRSLNFHRKMGFNEVGSTQAYIEFQTSRKDLEDKILRRAIVE